MDKFSLELGGENKPEKRRGWFRGDESWLVMIEFDKPHHKSGRRYKFQSLTSVSVSSPTIIPILTIKMYLDTVPT